MSRLIPPRNRPGAGLAELMVAMAMLSVVGSIVVALLHAESRLAGHAADRAEALDAIRTASAIFAAELSSLEPGADLRSVDADSVALRVFRGSGVVCGFAGGDPLVRYRGLRQPDPTKDSVLVVTASEGGRADSLHTAISTPGATPTPGAAPLLSAMLVQGATPVQGGGCHAHAGEAVFRLGVAMPLSEGDLVLVFESGSYHIDGAFRYWRDSGGRQPITAEAFTAASRFTLWRNTAGDTAGVALELEPATSTRTIRGAALADRARVRVTLRNRPEL